MKLLLDTNILMFAALGELPKAAQHLLEDEENQLYYSVAAIWELIIKTGTGKLDLQMSAKEFETELIAAGYQALPINSKHAHCLSTLKNVHRDPFDRIMLAQALHEGMDFISTDHLLTQYGSFVVYYAHADVCKQPKV